MKYTVVSKSSIDAYLKELEKSGHRELLLSDIRDISDETNFELLPAERM